jgi:CMP-2-keto-3-deoxyoctulosonic acid synthetase
MWKEALEAFARQRVGTLEVAESIDMLRFLEAGRSVGMVHTDNTYQAVDVPSDIHRVEALLEQRGLT